MTIHAQIPAANSTLLVVEPGTQIWPPAIDERQVRRIAVTGGAEAIQAAQNYAGATADQLNGGLRAQFVTQREELRVVLNRIKAQILDFDGQATARSSILWRRNHDAIQQVRMTKMERVQAGFYVLMVLAALSMATLALSKILMELETIEKVTESLWIALIYAFPVVLASSGVATMVTLHDDDKVIEGRIMRTLLWGFGIFVAWIVLTAIVFVGANGGFNVENPLGANNDPFAAAPVPTFAEVDSVYGLIGSVFRPGLTGTALTVVHIIAEVLVSGGIISKLVLMGRKTREIVAHICPRANLAKAETAKLDQERTRHTDQIAQLDRKIEEIDRVRAKHIEDVVLMVTTEQRLATSIAEAERAKAERDYLRAAL